MPEKRAGLTRLYVYYKVPKALKSEALRASSGVIYQMESKFSVDTELQIRADESGDHVTVMEAYLFGAGCDSANAVSSLKNLGETAFSDLKPAVQRHVEWFETVEYV